MAEDLPNELRRLLEDGVIEGRTVEYKRDLPEWHDSGKKEFLADVSSFANAAGGRLYFGISEESGIPVAVPGVECSDFDSLKLRIENLIRDGTSPRIPSTRLELLPVGAERVVLVVEVPRSWVSPHRVEFKGHHKFYSRNSGGKYPLNVDDLRVHFTGQMTLASRIREFRADRLSLIQGGLSPLGSPEKTELIVVHLLPLSAFSGQGVVELPDQRSRIPMLYLTPDRVDYNIDGAVSVAAATGSRGRSYTQIFRTGAVEAVDNWMLREKFPSLTFEREVARFAKEIVGFARGLGVLAPAYFGLSLLNVKGLEIKAPEAIHELYSRAFDRSEVIIPEIELAGYEIEPYAVLKPVFDMVWNAGGWPRSLNYDEDGQRLGR